MKRKVSEEHRELYHYTTAVGLEGIIRSQQLWATHIAYLNDAEEHVGFFIRRLPKLLEKPAREAVSELMATERGKRAVAEVGGPERAIADLQRDMSQSAHRVTVDVNEPYVTAFCSGSAHLTPNDGLLSQWRGYGSDGGYAIVFATDRLEQMLIEREGPAFMYQFASFSDVDYDYPDGTGKAAHPERLEWEQAVQDAFKKFILTQDREAIGDLHVPMASLSSRYKHHGFSEEQEVRIVAMPISDPIYEETKRLIARGKKQENELKPRKPIRFVQRRGLLVPYIELFGGEVNGPTGKLPILRVLVGPHPDREKRAASVRLLLKQHHIDAEVEASDTPYLGR